MVRFTDNSILIEINTGGNSFEQLNYYQCAMVEAMSNLNEEKNVTANRTTNYYLGSLLESMMFTGEQLALMQRSIGDKQAIKDLQQSLTTKSLDG